MSEKSLTLLEFHLDDGRIQIGPRTLSAGSSTSDESAESADAVEGAEGSADEESTEESGFGVGGTGKAALALLVVVGLSLAVWKLLGEDDLEAVADLDELAE